MTQDEIIRMAEEAGFSAWSIGLTKTPSILESFASLVAAAEREACASLAERVGSCDANMNKAWRNGCNDVAAAIRARGNQE